MQDSAWLAQAVRSRESSLLEHKQQWYELNTNTGKAEFLYAWASHLDVVLHVKYRDEEGMIQEFNVNLTIAGF